MAFHIHKGNRASPFRKEKERISRRFQMNLEAIIAKYDRPFSGSDVVDLNDMTIVEDQGFIGSMKPQKIGTVRLAVDKASSHSCPGTKWNSTKDSTDSAFGSTRYSESEDTSGTETIANYSFQATRLAGKKEAEKADLRLEDIWTRSGSHSEDSGNEDVESDHSGPIRTPSKSSHHSPSYQRRKPEAVRGSVPLATRRSSRGNLSRRFDAEEGTELKGQTSRVLPLDDEDEEESEEEDNDPYEFREEELPSILEEKNRFLSKMQSILVESFIDGDDIDEMESQTDDDEASTGTVESSEATGGSISAWSTLPPKTPPKRTSKPLRRSEDLNLDNARYEIPALDTKGRRRNWRPAERCALSSTDSDLTECSTILAGNLHSDRVFFRSSHLLQRANKDCVRNQPSQPPFQAICNSTMLSEINSSEEVVPEEKPQRSSLKLPLRGLELPLGGQEGEMCLGEVSLNHPSDVKPHMLDEQVNRTPKRGKNSKPINSARSLLPTNSREVNKGDESTSDRDMGQTIFRTPSTRNRSKEDGIMTPGYQDTSGITPRAKLRKGPKRQSPISLSSPRFDTKEIMEIFQSPKPLIIPGVDLKDLDLTPRCRVKQEGAPTPTRLLKDALRNLQSPKARVRIDGSCGLGSQTAKEIRPRSHGSADETALGCTNLNSTTLTIERSDADLMVERGVQLDSSPAREIDNNESFEGVNTISPEVRSERRRSTRLKGDSPIISELPKKVQRIPTPTRASPVVGHRSKSKTVKPDDHMHHCRSNHTDIGASLPESRQTRASPRSQQREPRDPTKKQSSSARLQDPIKMHRPSRHTRDSDGSDSDPQVLPASRESAPRRNEPTVEKSLQQAKPARYSSRADITRDSQKETRTTPVSSKTPSMSRRVENGPVTPTTRGIPSTLSSPLNHMSLATPHKFICQKKDKLSTDSVTRLSDQKKDRVEAVKQAKAKLLAENLRSKSRKSSKVKLDATHMTIWQSDDDSEEEMDVDPYSLTADDSSPGPRLYHQRPQLDPVKRSNAKSISQEGRHHDRVTRNKESGMLRYSKGDRQSTQSKDPIADGKKSGRKNIRETKSSTVNNEEVPLTGSSRNSHNPRDSENPVDSRKADASARSIKGPSISKKEQKKVSSFHRSNPLSPPPSPIYQSEDSPRPSRHDQPKKAPTSLSKTAARREHSQYFSDEEGNSSGDSAKFISSKPNQSELRIRTDPGRQSEAGVRSKDRKLYRTDEGSRSKHRTTFKCGQIITTPMKGFKTASPDLHKTRSPSRKGRVEKTRKLYPTSPVKTYRKTEMQTDRSSAKNSSKSIHGRTQNLKTSMRTLMASPSRRHGDVRAMETSRPDMSSPLRASGCNVSSSYVCEGPGHCTKPFCFNCALSEVS
ncbi:uncharacterized protein LOC119728758 [Patiria miniata]|uniref:Uncharacterized protein n=1 Tax=Patiria miniata TaxID=46514 RepID=A0A914A042_PATMI|nr:uncharacterized protein LOC119728758 [Patiria miniata]